MQLKRIVTSIQECSGQAQGSYLGQQLLFDVLREFALRDLLSILRADCGCRFHSWLASSRRGWWLSVRRVKNLWRRGWLPCTPAIQWSLSKNPLCPKQEWRILMFGRNPWRCKPIRPCLLTKMHVLNSLAKLVQEGNAPLELPQIFRCQDACQVDARCENQGLIRRPSALCAHPSCCGQLMPAAPRPTQICSYCSRSGPS